MNEWKQTRREGEERVKEGIEEREKIKSKEGET